MGITIPLGPRDLKSQLAKAEKGIIEEELRREGGNMTAAAKHLEIDRVTLYRKCCDLEIEPAKWRLLDPDESL